MGNLSCNPTHLAGPESFHIGHVLEQVLRGYVLRGYACIRFSTSMRCVHDNITGFFVDLDQREGQMLKRTFTGTSL